MSTPHGYIEKLASMVQQEAPFVAVTTVEAVGSTPQGTGSKILVDHQGLCFGTIGGGRLEHKAVQHAQRMLQTSSTSSATDLVRWNLRQDIGMTCGGVVQLFFELINYRVWDIAIFGAGHVANAIVHCLLPLDCHVTCWDSRQEWLDRMPKSEQLTKCCHSELASCVSQIPAESFVLVMTMEHASDQAILEQILKSDRKFPYVGVIGSRSKRGELRGGLIQSGLPSEKVDRFHCPIGLPLGSNAPGEIAISVIAQLLQVRDESRQAARRRS